MGRVREVKLYLKALVLPPFRVVCHWGPAMREDEERYEFATFSVRAASAEDAAWAIVFQRILQVEDGGLIYTSDPHRAAGARLLVTRLGKTHGFLYDYPDGSRDRLSPLRNRWDRWKPLDAGRVIGAFYRYASLADQERRAQDSAGFPDGLQLDV